MKIIVEVSGGIVQSIWSDIPAEAVIYDYDSGEPALPELTADTGKAGFIKIA